MSVSSDAKLLDYGDILLRKGDLDLLSGPYWLNDQVIAFYFEYLRREKYPVCKHLVLITGAITYLCAFGDAASVEATAKPLQFDKAQVICFAINDNPYVDDPNGGYHWSLLVFTRADETFRHFTTAARQNARAAHAVASGVQAWLRTRGPCEFIEARAPQQENGYDCGVYVLGTLLSKMADVVCARHRDQHDVGRLEEALHCITPCRVQHLRSVIYTLIKSKAAAMQTASL